MQRRFFLAGILIAALLLILMVVSALMIGNNDTPSLARQTAGAIYSTNTAVQIAINATETSKAFTVTPSLNTSAGSDNSPANNPTPAAQKRIILKNATLTLIVEDPRRATDQITKTVEEIGGWLVESTTILDSPVDPSRVRSILKVRVPAEQLEKILSQIKALAISINQEEVTGSDVTDQYVDLSSRLSNLQNTEAQLTEIMKKASTVDDVLHVQEQLTNVQEEIAVIKGRLQYFSQAAAYSLISLALLPKPLPTPTPIPIPTATPKPLGLMNWEPQSVAQSAADTMVGVVQLVVSLLIWFVVFLPLIIAVMLVFYVFRRLQRRAV